MALTEQKTFQDKPILNGIYVNMFDFMTLQQANVVIPEMTGTFCRATVHLGPKQWVSINIGINDDTTITFVGTDDELDAFTACKTPEELANMANSLGEARLQ